MALIQRDFRKDKPNPLRVRIVCGAAKSAHSVRLENTNNFSEWRMR